MHIQPMLQKTPMNDINDPFLLFFRHLVVTRKAQPTPENISPNVDSGAIDIGICAVSAIPLNGYERARPVYRLHMHGLPSTSMSHRATANKWHLFVHIYAIAALLVLGRCGAIIAVAIQLPPVHTDSRKGCPIFII